MPDRCELLDEPLSQHTTFKIGGPAERMLIPPDRHSLVESLKTCVRTKTPFYLIGRGSNILARDEGVKGAVIKNTRACCELGLQDGRVVAGSSVPLQTLIKFCVRNGLYGMEYLYSVPGNVGGAICMNAGRGREYGIAISDYLLSVEVFDGENVRRIEKKDCAFDYRKSVFSREPKWVLLSAEFQLPKQEPEIGRQRIRERLKYVKASQDTGLPNAGTVFKANFRPLAELSGYQIGDAQFSKKTPNWIVNLGNATSHDVLGLIEVARKLHRKRGLPVPELEIVILPDVFKKKTMLSNGLGRFRGTLDKLWSTAGR